MSLLLLFLAIAPALAEAAITRTWVLYGVSNSPSSTTSLALGRSPDSAQTEASSHRRSIQFVPSVVNRDAIVINGGVCAGYVNCLRTASDSRASPTLLVA